MYQRINGSAWRNIWLVGDLHGCFACLMAALRERRFDPYQDLLLSVGDLIDRGPQSAQCLDLLRYRWVCAVRGNHEQMALEALAGGGAYRLLPRPTADYRTPQRWAGARDCPC